MSARLQRKARTYLDVAISADEGLTWSRIARLEDDFSPGVRSHYPTAVADQGRIAVVYSKFYFGPYLDTALANNTAMVRPARSCSPEGDASACMRSHQALALAPVVLATS